MIAFKNCKNYPENNGIYIAATLRGMGLAFFHICNQKPLWSLILLPTRSIEDCHNTEMFYKNEIVSLDFLIKCKKCNYEHECTK